MRSAQYLGAVLLAWLALPAAAVDKPADGSAVPRRVVKDFSLPDLQGKLHTPAEWKDRKAVVLVFLATECPVCNGYAPELGRLMKSFASENVLLMGVHPDPELTADEARQHAREYQLGFTLLLDPRQVLAGAAGAHVTPEAVVLSPTGEVRYRGRIDDRYSAEGKRRDEPRTHDLAEAVQAVLAGKDPAAAETKAFGCPLPPLPKGK